MAYLPPAANLVAGNQVELRISCNELLQADCLSESDPLAALYTCNEAGGWSEVAIIITVPHHDSSSISCSMLGQNSSRTIETQTSQKPSTWYVEKPGSLTSTHVIAEH